MFNMVINVLKNELENQALAKYMKWDTYSQEYVTELIEAIKVLNPSEAVEFVSWEEIKKAEEK